MNCRRFSLAMNEIGDRYIEEALAYQAPAKPRPLLRMALAACLAAVMVLGTAMAVSAGFREVVVGWFKEQYEAFIHYEYRGQTGDDGMRTGFVPHRLTEIPPGYTQTDHLCDEKLGRQFTVCRNETEGKAFFVSAGTGGNAYLEAEGCTIRPVEVAGTAGELYLPDDPAKNSSIVWMKGDMFFCISGPFTPEELVYYAERLRPAEERPETEEEA